MTNTDREKIKEALHAVTTYKRENFKEPEDAWRALAIAIGAHLNVIEDTLRNASQADTKPAGGEWLPIESAPRDGTEILAYWSLGHGSHGCTKFLKGEWVNPEDCDDEYCAPDVWQPLPAPPLTRKENGE